MVEEILSLFYGQTAKDVKRDEIKENDDETGWKHKTPIHFHLTQHRNINESSHSSMLCAKILQNISSYKISQCNISTQAIKKEKQATKKILCSILFMKFRMRKF